MFVVFCSDERKLCPQQFRKGLFAAPTVTLWLTHSRKPPNPHSPLRVASVCFYLFCPLNKGKREENAIQMNVQFVFVCIVL
jgi:hypothetical protein